MTILANWNPIWDPFTLGLPTVENLFCDLVFGSSAGHPLDRFWPPLWHPWSDVLHFVMNPEAILLQMSKTPEQHFDTS